MVLPGLVVFGAFVYLLAGLSSRGSPRSPLWRRIRLGAHASYFLSGRRAPPEA
jgi:hypothetical protein